jgi:type VI protein secretion system component Hcp
VFHRSRHDEALAARRRRDAPGTDISREGLAGEALRLQELLGNTNVTVLIARAPLQRDYAPTARGGGDKEEKSPDLPADGYVMEMSGLEGPVQLESFQWAGTTKPGGGGSGGDKDEPVPKEIIASAKSGKHSPKLVEFAAKGTSIDKVVIQLRRGGKTYMTITMKGVAISSYQAGSGAQGREPVDHFGLNANELQFETSPQTEESAPRGGASDG